MASANQILVLILMICLLANGKASSKNVANKTYYHFNKTITTKSQVLNKNFDWEVSTAYPEIAQERRQHMNWDNDFLTKTYEECGKNNTKFLQKLRKEYAKPVKIQLPLTRYLLNHSDSDDIFSNLEISRVRFMT